MQKKTKKLLIFIAILILLALAFFCVCIKLGDYSNFKTSKQEMEDYNHQEYVYNSVKPSLVTDDSSNNENTESESYESVDYLSESRTVNSDIVAWLFIPDTKIDFPVVQCEDNSHYLNYDFEGKQSYMGCPFLDCRNQNDFSDFNSIIYGHNISNKYMFYPINYFKNANHFNEHPTGYLTTADKEYQINFIACDLVKSDDFAFNVVFLTKKEKEVFLKQIKENAVCIRDFEVEDLINKHIVALSTCSYEFDNARTVLFGWLEEVDS